LGFASLAGLAATGCSSSIPPPDPARVVQQALGQAQRVTGTAAPPNELHWVTSLALPVRDASTGPNDPARNQALGWTRMLDLWRARNPSITLTSDVVAPVDLTQQQIAMARGGTRCDVAYTNWGRTLGEAGVLDPLDVSQLVRKIVPAALPPQSAGDQVYALPVFVSALGLYLNHHQFEAAGLTPTNPLRDWSSFETVMQKLTDRSHQLYGTDVFGSGSPLSGQMRYAPFLWTAGGSFFSDAGDRATWNEPPGLDALIYLARLAQNYTSPGATTALDAALEKIWLGGQTATLLAGPELTVEADQRELRYTVQSIPAYIQGQSSSLVMSAGAVGVFARSRHKDWGLDFARFLASKEAQVAGMIDIRLLPANVDAGDTAPVFQQNPALVQFLRILREDDVHAFPMARGHNPEVQEIFRAYLGIALQGLATPKVAWDKSAAAATALLKAVSTPTPTS
jgi:ABC-type glycerol-3-phosphate transport system substrate-binding protein